MTSTLSISGPRRSKRHSTRRLSVAVVAAGALTLAPLMSVSGASTSLVTAGNVKGFSGALVNGASRTLYALSVEKGGKIKCQGSCLTFWPPLLVKTSVTKVSFGAGVKGKIGFVTRSKTMKQVTFNSFPVYTYSGDHGSLESNGEGISLLGGTWYVVKASSSSSTTTLFHRTKAKTPTPTTTTTTPVTGGAY